MDGGRFALLKTHQCCEVVFTPSPSHLLIKKPHSRFSTRKNGGRIHFSCLQWSPVKDELTLYLYTYTMCFSTIYKNGWETIVKPKAELKGKETAKSISHLPSHHWGHLQCTVPLSVPLKGRTLRNKTGEQYLLRMTRYFLIITCLQLLNSNGFLTDITLSIIKWCNEALISIASISFCFVKISNYMLRSIQLKENHQKWKCPENLHTNLLYNTIILLSPLEKFNLSEPGEKYEQISKQRWILI